MSRTTERFTIRLEPVQWALVNYYGKRRNEDCHHIVARMIDVYAKADKKFDPQEFMSYVRNELGAAEEDRATRDQLLREVVAYARNRHLADEPTATLPAGGPRKSHAG